MTYAENTSVPIERSKAELDTLLRKHGATQRVFADDDIGGRAVIVFMYDGRQYRLAVPLPKREEPTANDRPRRWWSMSSAQREDWITKAYEQSSRTRWRAVVFITKAKLEFAAMGVSTIEREFLSDLVLADGRTVHQAVTTGIEQQYLTGKPIALLGPAP